MECQWQEIDSGPKLVCSNKKNQNKSAQGQDYGDEGIPKTPAEPEKQLTQDDPAFETSKAPEQQTKPCEPCESNGDPATVSQ